ncbi:unnamed protein product [Dovyalis caffra]|uniref:glucan endo-1,3-beta-D-glucosidase n=1 Tax=Dovyalis caffra TaxID=77055 RepID=A0AAV1S692_9ROSI|nr:unnamed protein product [Dovyalis caffra]
MACLWLVLILSFAVALQDQIRKTSATLENIGVCYGMTGNNLPPATDVINLYKKYKIGNIRLFDPNPDALNALKGTQIQVTLGVRNEDVPNLAASLEAANSWVTVNVQPYLHDNPILLSYISVGNEIIPGPYSGNVLAAMKNLRTVLDQRKLAAIKGALQVKLVNSMTSKRLNR